MKSIELADRNVIESYFSSLKTPLSDYTFAQLYTWRNSLCILWEEIDNHLCIFANGTGDLTMLMPPIGDTNSDSALKKSFQIMREYNAEHNSKNQPSVEYASEELLTRFSKSNLQIKPMGADYIYDINKMISLIGSDLSSKRQSKNRFMRNYQYKVESYNKDKHYIECLQLLDDWQEHKVEQTGFIKRAKESTATELCLKTADILNLSGMVVYVNNEIKGFTFGEPLGTDQSSIIIEKTDLTIKGLAQFIFSDFCERYWSNRPFVNVGDDWGLETLAWTKNSYRPIKMLQKYIITSNL